MHRSVVVIPIPARRERDLHEAPWSMPYYVYILSGRSRNLYTGVTNNLTRRVAEHREGLVRGFTSRYRIYRLVHYECCPSVRAAIAREKEIKGWRREKKITLITTRNPAWDDLAADWYPTGREVRAEHQRADPSPGEPGSG